MLEETRYDFSEKATKTVEYVKEMIKKIILLKGWYELEDSPRIFVRAEDTSNSHYHPPSHSVTLTKYTFRSNFRLLSTLFHEFRHAFQAVHIHQFGK